MLEVPGYRIDRELGHGGMAVVYLAEQLSLQRQVALKVLAPRLSGDAVLRQRFLREGKVAASLRHRHIVAVHDVGEHGNQAYMAMEYMPLGTVTALCGRIAPADALRCVGEISSALDHAHRRGIVHRDIKPENILRHEDGAFMLTDFGIAHVVAATTVLTREGQTAGTPAYMAPELWRDAPIDGRVDFYALGVLLHDLLTGRPPYRGSNGWAIGMQHMSAPLPQLPPSYQSLQGLFARLLAKDPGERIADGDSLRAHIAQLERDGAVPLADPEGVAAAARLAASDNGHLRYEWPFDAAADVFADSTAITLPDALRHGGNAHASAGGGDDPIAAGAAGAPAAAPAPVRQRALRGPALVTALLLVAVIAVVDNWRHDTGEPQEAAAGTGDGYEDYLRGRQLLERGSGIGQIAAAQALFASALERDPGMARAHVGVCMAEFRRHELERDAAALERAAAACARAAALDPAMPELALAHGHLERARGNAGAASAHYRAAMANPLTRVEAHLGLARLAAAAEDDAEALRHFEQAHANDKGNWRVHLARGNFHFSRQQLAEAARSYREAARLAPDDVASPWTNLGGVHLALSDYPEASTALYRSVAAEPTHGALNNLGLVRFYLGDYAESAALLRRAVALAPGDYRGWGNLGDALSQVDSGVEEARRSYQRAAEEAAHMLEVNPDNFEVLGAMAWYHASLGEHARARELLARAERGAGADAMALRAAQVHARIGDRAAAERAVRRALAAGQSPREIAALPVLAPVLAGMQGIDAVLQERPRREVSQQETIDPG